LSYETIVIERRGHTACIRLDRPDVLNAINDEMIAEINQAAAELEADAEVWALIVTGTGRALCAGADVNKAGVAEKGNYTSGVDQQGDDMLGSMRQWDAPQEATLPYLEMTKPVICAVNGICAGAGLHLLRPPRQHRRRVGPGGTATRARPPVEHHDAARAHGQARAAVGPTGL